MIRLSVCYAIQSVLTGFHKGLHLAWDFGSRQLIVEVDSKAILTILVEISQCNNLSI